MNEQLQAQVSQILAQIMVSVGQVKDFSVQQLPEIVQQYINYGIWSNVFYCVISAMVFICCLFAVWKIIKRARHNNDEDGFLAVPLAFLIVVSSAFFFAKLHDLILVLTAPKVWFILEIKNRLS